MTRSAATPSRLVGLILAGAVATDGCALNRPQVKSLSDPEAVRIQFDKVLDTNVSALNGLRPQCGASGNHRVRDEEFHVYRLVGTITRVKREPDHDVHIILADPKSPRDHIVVEADDPDFRRNAVSPYRDQLAAGRRAFDQLLTGAGVARLSDLNGATVRVTGVGFFDFNHLQHGRSRSCIELHPILSIERLDPPPGA